MACIAITGAMKSNPTAAMGVLLNLIPPDPLIMAEARMALYRPHVLKQPAVPITVSGLASIWKNVGDSILDMWSDYIALVYYHSRTFNVIIARDYWRKKKAPMFPEDALIWFIGGSRVNSGTGSGIFGIRPNRSFSFPMGKFATVFQTEIHAILQRACENIRRSYKHKRILIFFW